MQPLFSTDRPAQRPGAIISDDAQSDTVLGTLEAGVLTLTLNRPDKLNSFNEAMHRALRAGFERAADDVAFARCC